MRGPAVLIPRVGRLSEGKVALFNAHKKVVISDCVIAIKTETFQLAVRLRRLLIANFEPFSRHWVGTGAPFITLARLREALLELGVEIDGS